MIGFKSVIAEIDRLVSLNGVTDLLEMTNDILEDAVLTEEEYNKVVEHLKI